MPDYTTRQRDRGQAEAKCLRPRPRLRPKLWPRGYFGLEDLTSLPVTSVSSRQRLWSATRGDLWHPCIRCGRSQGLRPILPMHIRARETVTIILLVQDGTKGTFPLRWLSSNCVGTSRPCNYYIKLRRVCALLIIVGVITAIISLLIRPIFCNNIQQCVST